MKFKDLKLGKKQGIGFAIILIIMTCVNIFAIRKLASLKAEIDVITTNWLPRAIAISDINLNTARLRMNQLQHAYASDEVSRREKAVTMVELLDKIDRNLDAYEKLKTESEARLLYSDKERQLYEAFVQNWDEYQELSIHFFILVRDNRMREAVALLSSQGQTVFDSLSSNLVELVTVNKQDALEAAQRAEITFTSTRNITITLLVVTFLLSIVIAAGLVKVITVPVQQLEKAAGEVAKGDLDVQLQIRSQDEIGNLAQSFNQMTTSLREAREKMHHQAQTLRAQNKQLEAAMKELRDTQDQLLLKEKMASLGNLVAGVAHELNTPVGVVTSSTDVVERCLVKLENSMRNHNHREKNHQQEVDQLYYILKENLRVTRTAGDRIQTIVKSLKNFAKLDESEFQKVNLHEGLDSALTLLEAELRDRIDVVKEYGKIPKIHCYPGQLNQVFMNLLRNAIDAIDTCGTIHLKTFRDNDRLCIQISDTGRGIPEDKLSNIFEFGFSSGSGRIKMASGLSTAYNIVQKHQGEIKVESEENKGTTFCIILPVR